MPYAPFGRAEDKMTLYRFALRRLIGMETLTVLLCAAALRLILVLCFVVVTHPLRDFFE